MQLPDKISAYEVKIELYEGETRIAEEILTREVTQTVLSYMNELVLELESLTAEGKDKQRIRKAIHHLEQIRSRAGDYMPVPVLNLHDAVQAAGYIGEVWNIDISSQRQKALEIMFIMGRWFYEKVKLLPTGAGLFNEYFKALMCGSGAVGDRPGSAFF